MTKTQSKVSDFLSYLRVNDLIYMAESYDGEDDGRTITHAPKPGVSLHYKGREVLEVLESVDRFGAHQDAMVIVPVGLEHFIEETITPKSFSDFEAFKKVTLPK